jgi:prophage regulatory protein
MQTTTTEQRLIRLPEVIRLTGIPKSTIYKLISDGRFPKPQRLGRLALWKLSEVDRFVGDPGNYAAL